MLNKDIAVIPVNNYLEKGIMVKTFRKLFFIIYNNIKGFDQRPITKYTQPVSSTQLYGRIYATGCVYKLLAAIQRTRYRDNLI